MPVTIDGKNIGDGFLSFVVFEAGPTHDGLKKAKELACLAAESGADAVKFQILDPDRLVPDRRQMFSYDILVDRDTGNTKTVSEPLYDILKRRYLTFDEWRDLKRYCDDLGIIFFSTATFKDEVDFVVELGCDTVKICSGDIDCVPFIEYCARTGMCIQLDTGNATIGDVERAVDMIRGAGNERIIIHNCPSGYPARLESINLRVIPTLKQMFNCPVAFSDHTPGWNMDIAAVALGANMVEKTITLDRTIPSVEHMFSLEPQEMREFIKTIREVEIALGNTRRIMSAAERQKSLAVRRSIILNEDVVKGQIVEEHLLEFVRPGFGIRPERYKELLGKRFSRGLTKGHRLDLSDFTWE